MAGKQTLTHKGPFVVEARFPRDEKGQQSGDKKKPVALFTCSACGAEDWIEIKSGHGLRPEALITKMRDRGWQSNRHSVTVFCPSCLGSKPKNDTDSELKNFAQKQEAKVAGVNDVAKKEPQKPKALAEMVVVSSAPASNPPAVTIYGVPPDPIKNATPKQRRDVRNKLDEFFDEDKGMYLDGRTDQSIAEELNVPRKLVEEIRKLSYGEIRQDETLVTAEERVAKLRAEFQEAVKRLRSEFDSRIETELSSFRADLNKIEDDVRVAKMRLAQGK